MKTNNRITEPENVGAIFNVFHDGTIDRIISENGILRLDISILYLAERVNPTYQFFFVTLHNIHSFTYTPWRNTPVTEPSVLTDLDPISAKQLEILSSTIKPEGIEVLCLETSSHGGTLTFNADYAIVHDQGGNELSLAQLTDLAEGYWSQFC
jgi:hypothetical protein